MKVFYIKVTLKLIVLLALVSLALTNLSQDHEKFSQVLLLWIPAGPLLVTILWHIEYCKVFNNEDTLGNGKIFGPIFLSYLIIFWLLGFTIIYAR